MKKLSRWFRVSRKDQTEIAKRAFEAKAIAEGEKRLKDLLAAENPELMEAVRRLRDVGLVT